MPHPQEVLRSAIADEKHKILDFVFTIQRRATTLAYTQYEAAARKVLRASGFITPENEDTIFRAIELELFKEEN